MTVSVVRLGSPRTPAEGLRLGTVRRPPRGVPRSQFATRDYYDIWLPILAPSAELVRQALAVHDAASWRGFVRKYRSEMRRPEALQVLDLLAALSQRANFSVGCYCADEARCHRSILRQLLQERGASVN